MTMEVLLKQRINVAGVAVLVTAGLLSACSISQDTVDSLYVSPGRYNFYDCKQLSRAMKTSVDERLRLTRLIEKANEGAGGAFVSAVAYSTDLAVARGQIAEIGREQRDKQCPAEIEGEESGDSVHLLKGKKTD